VSAGGVAVALAEICIRSGVGVAIDDTDWALLLDEAPGRFLAVVPAGTDLGIDDVPARPVGTIGGNHIDFGLHGSVGVDEAERVWRRAIPRRMEK
jgi:phosphoribosylformylglycinamidine synthase